MHSAMEQAKYWMWTRRKLPAVRPLFEYSPPPTIPLPASASAFYNESWEEKVFAEDSAGLFGGCVWPPRSYSCSFCGREFRSAQALGGHMNVHRRDRARLKQSSTGSEEDQDAEHHLITPLAPSHVAAAGYNNGFQRQNPNPNSGFVAASRPLISNLGELRKEALFSSYTQESIDLNLSTAHCTLLRAAPHESGLGRSSEEMKQDHEFDSHGFKRRRLDEEDEHQSTRKRKRMMFSPLFVVSSLVHEPAEQEPEVINLSPEPIEELDLELRLGDLPKVK